VDKLQNLETFVRVAQTGSFAEAARQLRIAKSVVTNRIKQLEEHVGAPLFHRSTRVVRLSEVGQMYLHGCEELVGRANDLVDFMHHSRARPAGVLKVHAIPGLVLGHFASVLHSFQVEFPDIRLELGVGDAVSDPHKAGVDCALQIFPPTATELIAKPLFSVRRVFCASPSYLRQHGVPASPRDLHAHQLGLYSGYPTRDKWTFVHNSEEITIYLRGALLTNSVHLLKEYALEHAGIVCIPTLVASNELLAGDLQIVLQDFALSSFQLSAVYAPTSRTAPKLRLFIEHISKAFGSVPPWDQSLIEKGLLTSLSAR
jgi:DNA-binding transcriptional LysR family regulator